MVKEHEKFVVLSECESSLLNYSGILNNFGFYSVDICSCVAELTERLEDGKKFQYLIVDAFDFSLHASLLKEIKHRQAINSIILIADVNSVERHDLFRWGFEQNIPLLGVLQAPLRIAELRELTQLSAITDERIAI